MTVRVEITGDIKRLSKDLKKLGTRQRMSMERAAKETTRLFHKQLRKNIRRSMGIDDIADSTKRKRRLGKKAGHTPAIPRYPGRRPLLRSKRLFQSIEMVRLRFGSYVVRVRPGSRGEQGQSLELLAVEMERGTKSFVITMTRRMLAYLLILYGRATGRAGRGMRQGERKVGEIVVKVPGRPIWRISFQQTLKAARAQFTDTYWKELGFSANFFAE